MRRIVCSLGPWSGVAVLAAFLAAPALAQGPSELGAREKTELFIQHIVKVSRIDPSKYQALVLEYEIGITLAEFAHEHEEGEEHEADESAAALAMSDFLERALREIQPSYGDLLTLVEAGRAEEARSAARTLAGSTDPYVAAHAALVLADLDFGAASSGGNPEDLDKVIRACERIVSKDRMYLIRDHRACELIALCFEKLGKPLLELVQYAILLTDYQQVPPEVAERAKKRLATLGEEVGRPLGTVANWMNEVEKLLSKEVTKEDPTQKQETEILTALDKLIELQEARERRTCPNCGSGQCSGNCQGRPKGNRSKSPARVSALAEAKGEMLLRGASRGDAATIWGQLKDRDASRAMQGFRGKLPPRYERLLEQYYKNLSKTE